MKLIQTLPVHHRRLDPCRLQPYMLHAFERNETHKLTYNRNLRHVLSLSIEITVSDMHSQCLTFEV